MVDVLLHGAGAEESEGASALQSGA
jgi:hypothetical protein